MKFDVVITGGGLSGLSCALSLAGRGRRCAIVSAGQNAMHLSSGCMNLLNNDADGNPTSDPFAAIDSLPSEHPYRKTGGSVFVRDAFSRFCELAQDCGTHIGGTADGANGFRISPAGKFLPSFASIDEVSLLAPGEVEALSGKKLLVVGIEDFLDFDAAFVAAGLEKKGACCRVVAIGTAATRSLRENPTEMRATNLARVLSGPALDEFISSVNALAAAEDYILLPAVFAPDSGAAARQLPERFARPVIFIGTLPPSVPGIRMQSALKKRFEALGGVFLKSDSVIGGTFRGDRLESVRTSNLEDEILEADNFVLSSGSFFSKGLSASPYGVSESALGVDCQALPGRENWYRRNFFDHQEYLGFGVATDAQLHCIKDGKAIGNLYAAGSVLGGYNPLEEGSGAGVAVVTGLYVADRIF